MKLPIGEATKFTPKPRGQLTELGELLDIVLRSDSGDDVRIRPKGKTALLWRPMPTSAQGDAGWLVWWMGATFKLRPADPDGSAARAYETWAIWEADRAVKATVSDGCNYRFHPAAALGYRSDKFERAQKDYEHEFGSGVRLYRPSQSGPWVVRGGKLRLTSHGIEG